MVEIRLTNSKTRRKETFVPLDPANVRVYLCGPTVYDRAHLGNARPVVVFDVLTRLLRHVYGDDHVTYVRNFTDVDDKINARAAATGRSIRDITDETIGWFHEDMDALGALRPDFEPRATEYIPQMQAMIADLIAKSHAYEADGHVLFDVRSYPDYGALSGRSVDDMIAGARVEVAPFKRDPMDFVLWKPSGPDEPGWDSPWGYGRPGWHIECSAMSEALLGRDFDIHGGGLDLMFPHHENEIAQSCCAFPDHGFARVWLHNEMLQVEGKKMSKSLGNFFTVREVLEEGKLGLRGITEEWRPQVLRTAFLRTHYRDTMDIDSRRNYEAIECVREFCEVLGGQCNGGPEQLSTLQPGKPLKEVVEALADDLDARTAIERLRAKPFRARYKEAAPSAEDVYASMLLLGIDVRHLKRTQDYAAYAGNLHQTVERVVDWFFGTCEQKIRVIVERIDEARAEMDFGRADRLRALLMSAGVDVSSSKEGTIALRNEAFDESKLPDFADLK